MGIARSLRGLTAVVLPQPGRDNILSCLGGSFLNSEESPASFKVQITRFYDYFAGKRVLFGEPLDLSAATPFQRLVWLKAKNITYGESRSYAWLASEVGKPGAARAVGQALGRNPLPIVIPCHRVLAANGFLGGFSGGMDLKRRLLRLEGLSWHETAPDHGVEQTN